MGCNNVEHPFCSLSHLLSLSLGQEIRAPMLPPFLSEPPLSLPSRPQWDQGLSDGRGAMGSLGLDGPRHAHGGDNGGWYLTRRRAMGSASDYCCNTKGWIDSAADSCFCTWVVAGRWAPPDKIGFSWQTIGSATWKKKPRCLGWQIGVQRRAPWRRLCGPHGMHPRARAPHHLSAFGLSGR